MLDKSCSPTRVLYVNSYIMIICYKTTGGTGDSFWDVLGFIKCNTPLQKSSQRLALQTGLCR
jgi:hypothetical protein